MTDGSTTEVLDELAPDAWSTYPHTLADVLPWIARGLGAPVGSPAGTTADHSPPGAALPGFEASDVVLLLVDGLGDRLLQRYSAHAPTLAALHAMTLRAGFPATTATSVTSLTSGAPCGLHGIIGYSFRPDDDTRTRGRRRVLNALRWTLDGPEGPSALVTYPPSLVAPLAGALSELADVGVRITYVMPGEFRGTGLTRAAFRAAGRLIPATTPEGIRSGIAEASHWTSAHRRLVYAYIAMLDSAGHTHGAGSPQWLTALQTIDQLVADIASDLPAGTQLVVTGDHGMLNVDERIDLDNEPELVDGLEAIAGEPRVRHLYVAHDDPGRVADVLATWRERLGPRVRIASRDQVLDERWFGQAVDPAIARRIGDVVAVARGRTVVVRSMTDPHEAAMPGHHGAWTAEEQLVPLLISGA